MIRQGLMVALASTLAVLAGAAEGDKLSPEQKLIRDIYGKRIAEALSSAAEKDNVSLGRELLSAAGDDANTKLVRYWLALEAVELVTGVGTEESARIGRESVALADEVGKLPPVRKAELLSEIAESRVRHARKDGAGIEQVRSLTKRWLRADLALVEAMIEAHELKSVDPILLRVRNSARSFRLTEVAEEVEQVAEKLKTARVRDMRLRAARENLERAVADKDEEAIKAAHEKIGLIYLLNDGNVSKANEHLSQSDHDYAPAVTAAVAFRKNKKNLPSPDLCNVVVELLAEAAEEAPVEEARKSIAQTATEICRAFLATDPKGLTGTKARLLLTRVEKLAGDSPADRFLRRLRKNYDGLEGSLEVVRDGVVRATYDFSSKKQLKDWSSPGNGKWWVMDTTDILAASPPEDRRSILWNRLRFRADKPVSLKFAASGAENLNAYVLFARQNQLEHGRHLVRYEFGKDRNRSSEVRDGGREMWESDKLRVVKNRPYRIRVSWDGKGHLTWTINGSVIHKHETQLRHEPGLKYVSVLVGLGSRRRPAGFDDVVIEGTVLEEPDKRLEPSREGTDG